MTIPLLVFWLACSRSDTSDSASSDSGPSATPTCVDLEQTDGTDAGYELCMLGGEDDADWVNRDAAVDCTLSLRDVVDACDASYEFSECAIDSECGTAGFCALGQHGFCVCETSCTTDDDCDADEACMCEVMSSESFSTRGECRPADCRTSDECPSGECGVTFEGPCVRANGLYCRTDDDDCRSDAECTQPDPCMFIDGRFQCSRQYVETCE